MNRDAKMQRMEELIEVLNRASKAYYDDASEIITNYEYDAMYDELLDLEKELDTVLPDSPSVNVGYTVKSELPKVQHEKKLLSLDKTKDRDELLAWLGANEGVLSWKLDGLTVSVTYEDGRLVRAVTRGNGAIGELITDNARAFANIPKKIECASRVTVRGEAVISYANFERINEAIDGADAKYKNPRNLCSGSVRQLDSRITAERHVEFHAFALIEAEGVDFGNSRFNQLEWLASQGFDVVEHVRVDREKLFDYLDDFEARISEFPLPVDGLVLNYDDIEYSMSLGTTAKFPRDAIAFKWRDQQAETVLREIEWSPSRTGLLNPVAIFDPVELEGTTVSRASVHNINIMEDLELGIGDTITVYKANMIIPQLSDNLTRSGKLEIPTACPVCGGRTEVRIEDSTKTLICTNPGCLAKNVKKFSHFVSRDAMNIDGFSEAGILKLIGKGILHELPDIYSIKDRREDVIIIEGFGIKSFDKLTSAIDASRKTTPARLLYSLGVPGIGTANSANIAKACRNSWDKMRRLTSDELVSIDGIGDVMSADYVSFFKAEDNSRVINRLTEILDIDETFEEAGTTLEGKIFVITGSLEHYGNRKELKAEIEAEGGRVTGSVTSQTDYLITNNPGSGSAKNKAARELGVSIITEDEVIAMLHHE